MKTRNSIIGLALITFMASCSSTRVTTDMDKATDFTRYNTYQLKPQEGSDSVNTIILHELNQKRIISAIETQAEASGMTASTTPDAYLVYGVEIDIQKGYSTSTHHSGNPYYGYGRRGRRYYGGGFSSSYSTTTETQTTNGTISIALIDVETDELLWISHGTTEINPKGKKIEENINKSIAKIFEDFPIEHNIELSHDPELLSQNH